MYFLLGSLPWQGLKAATKKQKYDRIMRMKRDTPTKLLCRGLPNEFAIYLDYTRSLRFDGEPDYSYLRGIFRDVFVRENFQYDYAFDWTVYNYLAQAQRPQAEEESGDTDHQKEQSAAMQPAQTSCGRLSIGQNLSPPSFDAVDGHQIDHEALQAYGHKIDIIIQPESTSSEQQLAAEAAHIYKHLAEVERQCISIDADLAHDSNYPLDHEKMLALTAAHRTLLHEHHDFHRASRHPSATEELKGLAVEYNLPARMWKHGIRAFLEVLCHRRPDSQDYMLAYVVLAYQMTALLYETVPCFADVWIACLGDIARFRMDIEDDPEMRSVWNDVEARWDRLASDRRPDVGHV